MVHLIRLTQVTAFRPGETEEKEVSVNVRFILMTEDTNEKDPGTTRVILTNGKSLFVEETQDEVRELMEEGNGGGLLGGLKGRGRRMGEE